jgi:hypothetical protein
VASLSRDSRLSLRRWRMRLETIAINGGCFTHH